MRALLAVPVVATMLLSGCTLLPSDESCLSTEAVEEVVASFGSMTESADVRTVAIRMEGVMEDERGAFTMTLDDANGRFSLIGDVGGEMLDLRVEGREFSLDTGGVAFYGRDHHPDGPARDIRAAIFDDGSEPEADFLADSDVVDGSIACRTIDGTPVVEIECRNGDAVGTVVFERDPPHRPVSIRATDPVMGDDYRMSFAYEPPRVPVRADGTRMPFMLYYEAVTVEQDDKDGMLTFTGRITDPSHWVPLDEVRFRIDDGADVVSDEPLRDGAWSAAGSQVRYEDRDRDGLVSTGDTFTVTYDPYGALWSFYDAWADEFAIEEMT